MSLLAMQGSVELGIIYAIMALGVFISFRTLNIPDLTVTAALHWELLSPLCCAPWAILGCLPAALAAGYLAGNVTALLYTKLKIQPLLAGILVMLGLYSVNLRVMDGRANIPAKSTYCFRFITGNLVCNPKPSG